MHIWSSQKPTDGGTSEAAKWEVTQTEGTSCQGAARQLKRNEMGWGVVLSCPLPQFLFPCWGTGPDMLFRTPFFVGGGRVPFSVRWLQSCAKPVAMISHLPRRVAFGVN